ncbi:MAG: hypothetical protein Q7S56_01885 [Nanoarchaeota archaeon]|nr:hypothetical protein [Nanoarchaeota archaeon]
MGRDATLIKDKIMSTLKYRGPSLPVHIANATGQSMLFSGAFLSELLAEKKIKISDMKVGSSPIYFLEGQEPQLENFTKYLKGKEREAFEILKEKKFLRDKNLSPVIRIALRSIKDFAVPLKYNEEIYWKYYTIPTSTFSPDIFAPERIHIKQPEEKIVKQETEEKEVITSSEEEKEVIILPEEKPKIHKTKKQAKKKKTAKQDDKFFNKVKDYLSSKSIEIIGMEGMTKNDLTLKVKAKNKEKLLIAYNKKKISETEIIRAHKKAEEARLPYIILTMGETPKKTISLMDALKTLETIEKIE